MYCALLVIAEDGITINWIGEPEVDNFQVRTDLAATYKRVRAKDDDSALDKEGKLKAIISEIKAAKLQLAQGDSKIGGLREVALTDIDLELDAMIDYADIEDLDRITFMAGSTSKESAKMAILAKAFYKQKHDDFDLIGEQLSFAQVIYNGLTKMAVIKDSAGENGRVSWEALSTKARMAKERKLVQIGKVIVILWKPFCT